MYSVLFWTCSIEVFCYYKSTQFVECNLFLKNQAKDFSFVLLLDTGNLLSPLQQNFIIADDSLNLKLNFWF